MTTIGDGNLDFSLAPEQHQPLALRHAHLEALQARQNQLANDDPADDFNASRQRRKVGAAETGDNEPRQNRTARARQNAEPLFGRRLQDDIGAGGPRRPRQNRRFTDLVDKQTQASPPNTPGLPVAGFLAQFIAQEVVPENLHNRSSARSGISPEAALARYRESGDRSGPDAVLAKQLDRV